MFTITFSEEKDVVCTVRCTYIGKKFMQKQKKKIKTLDVIQLRNITKTQNNLTFLQHFYIDP